MAKKTSNEPVVLQVLPELEMGGVELGTIEIALNCKNKELRTLWHRKAVV